MPVPAQRPAYTRRVSPGTPPRSTTRPSRTKPATSRFQQRVGHVLRVHRPTQPEIRHSSPPTRISARARSHDQRCACPCSGRRPLFCPSIRVARAASESSCCSRYCGSAYLPSTRSAEFSFTATTSRFHSTPTRSDAGVAEAHCAAPRRSLGEGPAESGSRGERGSNPCRVALQLLSAPFAPSFAGSTA